ncbi:MAG: hypothetical protein DCC43_05930 [Candidatus Brocadia sp.]|uniref:DUF4159 domain-containing protein n=1 Tax=Candidatus Brocadia fulgida TaxID=380242 RepID=A0A0M2UXC1_9BACT|nr:MAG: hypothetical protein BROFUL_01065 [Candidatus Brocadia fulgida]MCC6324713.1 DUF4159 domain-containing protein [Candidatus Brocadia sp.]MCE7910575.1 DUF4159 domain-containing protein [Candidatus Brocadia sp. AMX3]MBV6518122.1 hypothetical protein [Candidatus Brocadia fulgida]MDG5996679.1 DUF4159 domain-containing protein [Candidatus Brocadia sp.]
MAYSFSISVSLWFIICRTFRFFICVICAICGFIFLPQNVFAMGEASKVTFAQLEYSGGNWNPRPNTGKRLMWELVKRTSVEARIDTVILRADDANLFEYPFLYMSGDQEFPPFGEREIGNLKLYLEFGGTLLIDDCIGKSDFGFDKSVRREIKRLFANKSLEKLPAEHTIFKSFYLLNQAYGRIVEKSYLEGVTLENRAAIIYSQNDLGGAWSKDPLGTWEYQVTPGGEVQRSMAFRLGINIIMYALTGDYKQDQVHLPFILKRQM